MKILIGCEFSQVVTEQFHLLDQGHDIISCDLIPAEKNYPHHKGDIRDLFKERFDLGIIFPPCTHLTTSGARWFLEKIADGRQQKGINFFMEMINAPIDRICVENPVGIMSSVYKPPTQYIQPCDFGELYTKKTGLWLKNLPKLRPTNIVEPTEGSKVHTAFLKISNKVELSKFRSRFPIGIAKAMANQWTDEEFSKFDFRKHLLEKQQNRL